MFITKRLLTTEKLTIEPKESITIYPQNLFLAQNPNPEPKAPNPKLRLTTQHSSYKTARYLLY